MQFVHEIPKPTPEQRAAYTTGIRAAKLRYAETTDAPGAILWVQGDPPIPDATDGIHWFPETFAAWIARHSQG